MASFAQRHYAVLQWEEHGATLVRCARPSHILADEALFQTFEQERVKMWTNAKPSLGCVKEEIVLIQLDLLSANAQLDTDLMN